MAIGVGAGDYAEYLPFVAAANYDFILFTFDTPSVAWGYSVVDDTWTEIRDATDTFVEGDFNYGQNVFKFGGGDVRSIELWIEASPGTIESDSSLDSGVTLTHHATLVESGASLQSYPRISPNGDYWVAMSDQSGFGTVTTVRFYKSSDKGDTWELVYEWNAIGSETFIEFCVTISSLYIFVTPHTSGAFADALMYYLDLADTGAGVSLVSGMPVTDVSDQWAPSGLLAYPAINADVLMIEATHYFNPITSPNPTNFRSLFKVEAGVATDITDPAFPNSGSPNYDTEYVDFQSYDGILWLGNSLGDRGSSGNYLMRTDDAGATWTVTQTDGLNSGDTLISIALLEDGTALRTIQDTSAFPTITHKVQKSTDFGATWADVSMPATFTNLGGYVHHGVAAPGGGGGPAVLFIGGGFPPGNDYSIDIDNLVFVSVSQNTTDSDTTRGESTDGSGLVALLASDNTTWEGRPFTGSSSTSPAALPGLVNALIFIFRDGLYRILVFPNAGAGIGIGGEFSSPDGLAPWTQTGRVAERDFGGPSGVWPADLWCATELHAYYVMREDGSFSGLYRSILVDSEAGLSSNVYKLEYPAPADAPPWEPPTGGTFAIAVDDGTITPPYTNPIAWNASAATILGELNLLPAFGAGGSASGSFATAILITDPNNGFRPGLIIDISGLTSAGPDTPTIFTSIDTLGQNGVGTFVTDPSVGSPVYTFHKMWGSFTGDVTLVWLHEGTTTKLWKLVGTAAPVDVTPGFVISQFDSLDNFISPDGVTWLGSYFSDANGDSQLMQSDDSGATWTLVGPTKPNIIHVVFDPAVANKWWAFIDEDGTFAHLYVSTDNGATWSDFGADPYFFGGNEKIVPVGGRTN